MEIWKDIKGYESLYQVSNLGRVKSLEKKDYMHLNKCYRIKKEIILRYSISNNYRSVSLYRNKKQKTFSIHRLVAIHFIDNIKNKKEVNHINGIKTDNRVENLEWVTSSENQIHALEKNLYTPKKGGDHSNSKLNEKKAYDIFISDLNNSELSKIFRISISVISSIRNKRAWKHIHK
jgi:hypothetical protein